MKSISNINKGSRLARFPYSLAIKNLFISALICTGIQTAQAQEAQDTPEVQKVQYTQPSWWFGAAAGVNFNFYRGTTQQLNSNLMTPSAFHDGSGISLFAFPIMEFHPADSKWGFMLQAGYESRKSKWDQVTTPCNCPADLRTELAYITIEPSLRLNPFNSNFYVYAGPRLAYNVDKRFYYDQGINPAIPTQVDPAMVQGNFSDVKKSLISMQVGAGYDIPLSKENNQTQVVLAPFVAFHPYFGQDPRSVESWNLTALRAGLALKFGSMRKVKVVDVPEKEIAPEPVVVVPEPEVTFVVNSPENIQAVRAVVEVFPLRNYVYFDLGSTEIPNRYVKLRKDQVKDFKEEQVELFTPENLSGRSARQMIVYYNVLNILGDRMVKDPSTSITLIGSSEKGPEDGQVMAESVKTYLVDIFGIDASRITTEGRKSPKIKEERSGEKPDLVLRREGDRRVSIESNSSALLMEFQSGPDAPLKPVEIVTIQEAPVESYVTFNAHGADEAFSSWSLEIADEQRTVQNFGPYTEESVSIPGESILGTRPEGDYKIMMIGQTKSGKVIRKETSAHLVLWTPPVTTEVTRFSIIYEFNNSKAIKIYEKYLTEVVTPKIPENGTVIIKGHTDIIGGEDYNLKLSLARANDTRGIIEKALTKAGRNDVKFEVDGFGEDEKSAPFENKFPEERSYNRSVTIDIVPAN
ncbi:MAG TPA: outer membrane beta-barrel protein [Prolixibacteraceae bacterium]|nr:outer membrane beta-barrel protein [Prolixibacteraceae bacterium]